MRHLIWVLLLAFDLAVWAEPAGAQRNEHTLGGAAFSSDGSLVAFHTQSMPKTEFAVLEVSSGKSFRFVLPAPHIEMHDLVWARSTSTLMFVSLDPAPSVDVPSYELSILSGYGTHIWSIAFTAGEPQAAKVLATREGVRLPALSPDGSKVAYFLPVRLPREQNAPPNRFVDRANATVFETNLATGQTSRVSLSQFKYPRALYYDGPDGWFFSADEPSYLSIRENVEFWSSTRPSAPPGKGMFDQLTSGIKSFRLERGETLPDYPDYKRPHPANAPIQSRLTGVTADGRPILYGAPGPENTAGNQLRNSLSRAAGVPPVEIKEGFMAFAPDGRRTDYFLPSAPATFDANTGGIAVDGGLTRFVTIMMKTDPSKPDYGRSSARLFLFEDQKLILERDVSDILAKAKTVQIGQ